MLSKEIKKLLELSGGKLVISDGDLKDSYVVMNLEQYLREQSFGVQSTDKPKPSQEQKYLLPKELTDQEILDRINAEIDQLRHRQQEREMEELFDEEDIEEIDYDYIQ